MWYDLPPSGHAKGLRFGAERSDECAVHRRKEGKSYSEGDAQYMERQARRLRAMALLCDRSCAARAGDVDFRSLHHPALSREAEYAIVTEIEAGCAPVAA